MEIEDGQKKNNLPIIDGHKKGAEIIKKIVSKSIKLNIKYLTFYGFSTENWNRSKDEVVQLQSLLKLYLDSETDNFIKNKINFSFIGDVRNFESHIREKLNNLKKITNDFNKLFFTLALGYGSRCEILGAINIILNSVLCIPSLFRTLQSGYFKFLMADRGGFHY